MLGAIWDVISGILNLDFSVITENIITLLLALFGVGLGVFSIFYLGRRRRMLDHERMAAIIKGLHYAGVTRDVFKKPAPDSRDHLLRGLRWLFAGLGVAGALYTYGSMEPAADAAEAVGGAAIGAIPGAIGLAHLIFAGICRRRERREEAPAPRMVYRPVVRRY